MFLLFPRYLDINECSTGSHDCHENAICVNTAGHFNCSCKPGYSGDGRLCSGTCHFSYKTVLLSINLLILFCLYYYFHVI